MARIAIGEQVTSRECGIFEVVSKSKRAITVKFLQTGYTCTTDVANIRTGGVRDPYFPKVSGVGFVGVGDFLTKEGNKKLRSYGVWSMMLGRCYKVWQQGDINFTYNDCTVDTSWHNFQNFALWYTKQKGCETFELDKDLLTYGNRVYSPASCVLIPHEINIALQDKQDNSLEGFPGVHFKKSNQNYVAQMSIKGRTSKHIGSFSTPEAARDAYLLTKKKYLADLAEQYKSAIDERAYQALIAWEPK